MSKMFKKGNSQGKKGNFKQVRFERGKWIARLVPLTLLTLLLVISGCGGGGGGGGNSGGTTPPPSQGIAILVEDAFTRSPISGATINIGNQTLSTDNQGNAHTSPKPGIYDLTVSKSGYTSFSLKVPCSDGEQFRIRLTPVLSSSVTDETFHQCSQYVLGAATGLREAFSAMNSSNNQASFGPLVFFISASNAFTTAMDYAKTYSPRKRNSRSVVDALSNFLSLTKVAQGTEKIQQVNAKLLSNQDVPEIDQWLQQHPYEGAHSLQELRNMYDQLTLETVIYPRLLRLYQIQSPDSGFNYALDGAKDIWCSQFTQVGEIFTNLVGWTVDKIWSGTKELVVNTINYSQLVLGNTEQIIWLWEKGKQQLLIGKVEKGKPLNVPQGTMDLIITNGPQHEPYIQDDYQVSGTGTQTLSYNAEALTNTIPTEKVYTGSFSGTTIEGDTSYCAWQHSVSLNLELHLQGDGTLISPYQGTMYFTGYDDITLLVCNEPAGCDPGGKVPIQVQMNITGNNNNISGSVTWAESAATNTLTFNGTVSGDTVSGTIIFASDAFNSPIQKTVVLKLQQ